MRRRSARGSASRDAHAVERDLPALTDRRSAAADGRSCSCRRPTGRRSRPSRPAARGTTRRRARTRPAASDRRSARASNATSPRGGLRQRDRLRRRLDAGFDRQDFDQPLGRARRLRNLAPDLAQLPEPARGEHRIEDELAERAGRGAAGEHVLRADPEDHARRCRKHQEDDDRGEDRARADRLARRLEGALDRAAEARLREPPRW